MQDTTEFRTNRDLFSNHYLDHLLPESDPWVDIDDEAIENAYTEIRRIYDEQRPRVEGMNEAPLEEEFIKPILDALGHTYAVQEEVREVRRYPDYAFFADEAVKSDAYDQQDGDETDFYRDAVAVGDAKRWGRKLDKLGGERRNFSNPSHQINVYLQETPAEWAILTNGKCWRLYYAETSRKLDSYYEIDLEALLEDDDCGVAEFEWFYNFFRAGAFVADAGGESFLDRVYNRSATFAQELGEDLEDNIYEAIRTLAEGFLSYPGNDLSADDLALVHDSSLVYLYRLLFVFYAESEGRDLLDTQNRVYDRRYSLNTLKAEVREELATANPEYTYYTDDLWHRLENLFELIDRGSESRGIPREELYVPAYNGGLFRTEVDAETSREIRFLQNHEAGDTAVARVIDLLARRDSEGPGTGFMDYSSLDIRHLGSIYEGLLEYDLNVAEEPLAVVDGEYVSVTETDGAGEETVEEGAVYLTTDKGERKATGSYYTPEYVVQYIVENTLDPLIEDIREELLVTHEENFAEAFAERVFDLKILDPAMGSGHFLTNVVDHLANEIVDAQAKQGEEVGEETVEESHDIHWARRQVVQRCVYGVDVNPLAVELAKVSLWLRTLAAEQPLAFLDHHLKTGNSLVGSDIEEIDELDTDASDGPNASLADFGAVRRGTIDHLMDVYEEFIAIENTDLADVKEMERRYREIERDDLRTRLVAMANVETAEDFGLDLPSGAYERMARALDSADEWAAVAETDWFQSAQALAAEHDFLHWKLEFPEVFYEVDGSDRANPGFDAVVGNPPYVRMEEIKPLKPLLRQRYEVHADRMDLYGYFVERAVDLIAERKHLGYIISNKWVRANYGEPIRDMLTNRTTVRRVLDFRDLPVFNDARTYPLILIASKERNSEADGLAATVPNLDFASLSTVIDSGAVSFQQKHLHEAGWAMLGNPGFSLLARMQREHPRLADYIESPTLMGVKSGLNEAFVINEETQKELITRDENSEEIIYPLRTGRDIRRYRLESPGTHLIYTHHDINIEHYPAIKTHLESFRERLENRATEQEWYELQQPQEAYKQKFKEPKIIQPDIAEKVRFHLDSSGNFLRSKANFLPVADYYLLAILNSKLSNYYLGSISIKYRGDYMSLKGQYVEELPIHRATSNISEDGHESVVAEAVDVYETLLKQTTSEEHNSEPDPILNLVDSHLAAEPERADVVHSLLAEFAERMSDFKTQQASINLSLPDYLGTYTDGEPLGERYQPPTGLADSILTTTATDYESLRIGTVSVASESSKLVVRATARYKPDNPDEYETDRWGYTETDPQAAMEFVGLSEAERGLVEVFVPYAVNDEDNFSENATKTISPLDRLEGLALPALSDVEDGLERYLDAEERATELDKKIEKTDNLIDQIVYELYGLTDEEIEIVEEAVGDD